MDISRTQQAMDGLTVLGGNEGLELGGGERVDMPRLRRHQQQHLRSRQCAELVGLKGAIRREIRPMVVFALSGAVCHCTQFTESRNSNKK